MYTPSGFTPSHVLPETLPETTLAFAFRGERILVGGDERAPLLLTRAELASTGLDGPAHYLGDYQGTPCVAVTLSDDAVDIDGLRFAGLRSLFFVVPEPLVAIAGRAFQVSEWDRTHRYCGRCGTATQARHRRGVSPRRSAAVSRRPGSAWRGPPNGRGRVRCGKSVPVAEP